MKTKKVLLAGATGYLGQYIAKQLIKSSYDTSLIVRDLQKVTFDTKANVIKADVTNRASLQNIFQNIDVVISTVGITRQKDGLTYMDVDYQANVNMIEEAKQHGVKKFIYVSALNADKLRQLKICDAKEKLVDYLKSSGLDYCIIRPNGFFSDMGDFLKMAKGGKVYLFGHGNLKLNPIHGEDLAKVCVESIETDDLEIEVGGPEILTHNQVATMALKAHSKKVKIIHLPDWVRRTVLWILRNFTSEKTYGPAEFFLSVTAINMVAPKYGEHRLENYFRSQIH